MDDEHFLRLIQIAAADPQVRHDYANWLTPHGPARAAFVRSELDWQTDANNRDERLRHLRSQSASFDPVWINRLARPPLGICFNDLTFSGNRPRITTDTLRYLEGLLDVELPAPYRAFLLNHNGGTPTRTHLVLADGEVREVGSLLGIYSPQGEPMDFDQDLVGFAQLQFVGDPPWCQPGIGLADDLIKVGYCLITGFADTLCLGFRGPRHGQIWLVDPCTLPGEATIEHFVAPSFTNFLSMLTDQA